MTEATTSGGTQEQLSVRSSEKSTGPTRYILFEELSLEELHARVESGELPRSTNVLVECRAWSGDGPEDAINAYAASIDKEGRTYAATAERFYRKHSPRKKVVWT